MTLRLICADVREGLAQLADDSVHCVVTSPPYYGLRDYGIEPQVWGGEPGCGHKWGDERQITKSGGTGKSTLMNDGRPDDVRQRIATGTVEAISFKSSTGALCRRCGAWRGSLGLEPTLDLYLDHMVEVCREVRRVLRRDGTFWLNIGDSYGAGSTKSPGGGRQGQRFSVASQPNRMPQPGLKPKDVMLIPARLAIRLCDDGWWLRSEITWAKKAPMPESVTDRPTSATEKVFLLTKSAKYYYDGEAVKEDAGTDTHDRGNTPHLGPISKKGPNCARGDIGRMWSADNGKRNMRNWWLLGPEPFPEAHFAVFPTEIPRRAILAGTSERGVCPKCGAPWARVTRRIDRGITTSPVYAMAASGGALSGGTEASRLGHGGKFVGELETLGWGPTCGCAAGDPVPATVLDPFLGAGTTALVADRLGRDAIGIELSPRYVEMTRQRVRDDAGLFYVEAAE